MELALSLCGNSGIDICSERKLSTFEFADCVVRVGEDPSRLQDFEDAFCTFEV